MTERDILAFRFAGAGHDVIRGRGRRPLRERATDPVLRAPADRPDMVVGEVNEGAARFNAAMRDPVVLEAALTRFGCCPAEHAGDLVRDLLGRGHGVTPAGHSIRMVAFGDTADADRHEAWPTVSMRHVVQFLRQHLKDHWQVLRHAQVRDPVLGVLTLIEKWGVDDTYAPERGSPQPKGDAMPQCECGTIPDGRRMALTSDPGAGKTPVLDLIRRSFCSHVKVGTD